MKSQTSNTNSFVKLGNEDWLRRLRIAGKCVASVMTLLEGLVKNETNLSLLDIDNFAEQEILKQNCTPTFKGYKGFPAAVCMSVDNANSHKMVHGIPDDYKLKQGDLISFDFGATFEEAIADSAITVIFGNPNKKQDVALLEACQKSLYAGIKAAKVGNRVGAIGNAIYKYSRDKGYVVIEQYGGHGICDGHPHSDPFVANRSTPDQGVRIQPGMTLAIEPQILPYGSSIKTKVGSDGWTVYSENTSAHFEHTMFIHEDHTEIITMREGEVI